VRSILQLFIRNGGFVTFVLIQTLCFYLMVTFGDVQKGVWANTSVIFSGKVMAQRHKVTRYIGLQAQVDSLAAENAALRNELINRQMMQIILPDTFYTVRIDSLRNKDSRPQMQVIAANVINNSTNGASNWFTINRGSRDGVAPSSGVISRNGLVGIIRYVNSDYAMGMSVLHQQTRISATLRGLLGSLTWSGDSPTEMTLNDIPKDVQPLLGDSVLTSGASLMFPAGHLIGYVSGIDLPSGSNFYAIRVRLSHNMAQRDPVYVVRNRFNILTDSLETFKKAQ
jgi:rod shape-determining protein MreC